MRISVSYLRYGHRRILEIAAEVGPGDDARDGGEEDGHDLEEVLALGRVLGPEVVVQDGGVIAHEALRPLVVRGRQERADHKVQLKSSGSVKHFILGNELNKLSFHVVLQIEIV